MPDTDSQPDYTDPGPHRCHNGWLTRTDTDHPKPCLTCKPWLRTPTRPGAMPPKTERPTP